MRNNILLIFYFLCCLIIIQTQTMEKTTPMVEIISKYLYKEGVFSLHIYEKLQNPWAQNIIEDSLKEADVWKLLTNKLKNSVNKFNLNDIDETTKKQILRVGNIINALYDAKKIIKPKTISLPASPVNKNLPPKQLSFNLLFQDSEDVSSEEEEHLEEDFEENLEHEDLTASNYTTSGPPQQLIIQNNSEQNDKNIYNNISILKNIKEESDSEEELELDDE